MTPSTRIVFLLMLLYGKATEAQELISKIPEVSTAKIIAVGESSHSVAEFTKLKADFFRELVKAGITKTLFIESDFSGVSLVNDWVWRRNGEPLDSVMKTGLYRAWRGKDMADLLTWMRDYNSSKPDGERVSIKGVDSQMGKFATPIVEAYLTDRKVLPSDAVTVKGLKLMAEMGADKNYHYRKLSKEDQNTLDQSVLALRGLVDKHDGGNPSIGLHMKAIEHCLVYQKANPLKFTVVRDANMAELALELLKSESKPVFLWAHNSHIAKSKNLWYKPLGYYLHEALADKYLSVALDFYEGKVQRPYTEGTLECPPLKDAEWIGNQLDKPPGKLSVINLKNYGTVKLRDVGVNSGSETYKTKSNQSFNYLVYLDKVTPLIVK